MRISGFDWMKTYVRATGDDWAPALPALFARATFDAPAHLLVANGISPL